jgi:triose/dihydroxyacetone kinase / FAD-AMP lyase (cyclizing)
MPGFSISLTLLPRSGPVDATQLVSLLDAPAQTPGWKWTAPKPAPTSIPAPSDAELSKKQVKREVTLVAPSPEDHIATVQRICEAVVKAEPEITRMDTIAGDGDCGLTLKAGAQGVLEEVKKGTITGKDLVDDVVAIAKVAEKDMGGTSGALYS